MQLHRYMNGKTVYPTGWSCGPIPCMYNGDTLHFWQINYQLTHSTSALPQLSCHNATGDRINILHAGKGGIKAVGCSTHGPTFHPTTALHGNCCWGIVDMPGWAFHKRHWVCQQQQASRTFQHKKSSTADNQPIHTQHPYNTSTHTA